MHLMVGRAQPHVLRRRRLPLQGLRYPGRLVLGACLEVAGSHHIVTRDCEIWTGNGGALNVNNVRSPCYLYFKNVRIYFDAAHLYQSKTPHQYSSLRL